MSIAACTLAIALGLGVARVARADTPPADTKASHDGAASSAKPPPGQEANADAFAAFLEGQRAFEHGDYLEAGKAFEEAYRISPHADVSWNAARAWDRAGELGRAANAYARYLDEAPPSARDRDSALQALARLSARLGRIDVVATGLTDVRVDDVPVRGSRVYVTPGAHVVRAAGAVGDRRVTKTASVAAGEATSVVLLDEPPPPARDVPPPIVVVAPPEPAFPVLSTGQDVVVGVGFGLTAISAGILVWSGVDTLSARSSFNHAATPQALEDGRAKETRTNVLVATTTALGAASTAATLIFALTGHRKVEARVGCLTNGGARTPAITVAGSF